MTRYLELFSWAQSYGSCLGIPGKVQEESDAFLCVKMTHNLIQTWHFPLIIGFPQILNSWDRCRIINITYFRSKEVFSLFAFFPISPSVKDLVKRESRILSGETVGTGDNLYFSAQVPTSKLSSHLLGFTWLYGNYFVKSWFQPFIKSISW